MTDGGEFFDGTPSEARDSLAPVIPLFGGPAPTAPEPRQGQEVGHRPAWNATWADDPAREPAATPEDDPDDDADAERELAEKALLRKLRTRSLSLREARAVVAERQLDAHTVDAVIDGFVRLGYLDDAALAEQLVHSAVDRKGQGRQAIAQTLAKRGIPRDVADAAIAEMPDDDAERALEFARTKARSMSSLEPDAALRRLMGQLARRGYGGSVAMGAAKQALSEAGGSRSGVRFR
ncbi:MAG: regulatory protein RecX [Microbacterium sp.]